jgi:hypothetical protein
MSHRALAVALAVAAAVAVAITPCITASAKDDPAAIKAKREAVRKKYKDAKKYPFGDLSYYCDASNPKEFDSRWSVSDTQEPADVTDGHPMFAATLGSGNDADPVPVIEIYVWRTPHWKDEGGGKKSTFNHEFKSIGESVQISDVKKLAIGYYEDWIKECKDFIKDKSMPTTKKSVGPAEFWGYAVGTDKDKQKRIRRDWYLWAQQSSSPPFTWLIQCDVSEKYIDSKERVAKILEVVSNIKELKEAGIK